MSEKTPTSPSFPVLRNSLAVLRAFESGESLLGVTELSERTGLHKSSISRLLVALEEENLVARDPQSRRYHLALGLVQLAGPFLGSLDIRRATRPALAALRDETSETAALIQWTGAEAVVVEEELSPQEIAHNAPVGTRYHTALSSSVQVFLAELPKNEIERLLSARPARFADAAQIKANTFWEKLQDGKRDGVFCNVRRSSPDAVGIASPIRDHRGDLVAAVLLAAPAFRTDDATLAKRIESVRRAGLQASAALGAAGGDFAPQGPED